MSRAVGHRIVHGGADVRAHQLLTPAVMESLRAAIPFAPLHLPAALSSDRSDGAKTTEGPAGYLSRHSVSSRDARGCQNACPSGLGARLGGRAIRISWPIARIDRGADGSRARTPGGSASRQRSEHHGDPERSIDRHQHGLDAVGGNHDGYPQRRHGSGNDRLPDAERLRRRRKNWRASSIRESGLLGVSETTSDVRELLRKRGEDPEPISHWKCSAIRWQRRSHPWRRLYAVWMCWYSLGVSASMRRRCATRFAHGLKFLGDFQVRVLPAQEDLQIARIAEKLAADLSVERDSAMPSAAVPAK